MKPNDKEQAEAKAGREIEAVLRALRDCNQYPLSKSGASLEAMVNQCRKIQKDPLQEKH